MTLHQFGQKTAAESYFHIEYHGARGFDARPRPARFFRHKTRKLFCFVAFTVILEMIKQEK